VQRKTIVADNACRATDKGDELLKRGLATQIFDIEPLAHQQSGRHIRLCPNHHNTNSTLAIALGDVPKALGIPLLRSPCASWRKHQVGTVAIKDPPHPLREPLTIALRNTQIRPRGVNIIGERETLELMTGWVIELIFNKTYGTKHIVRPSVLLNTSGVQKSKRRV
jgi:hypothetical protein